MKKRYLILVGLLAAAVLAAGCGKKKEEPVQKAEVTVTPTPKADGGLVDMQKTEDENAKIKNIIGTKTETSGSLVLINNMGDEISSIYIRPNVPEEEAYDEDGEDSWGNELVQGKFTLKNGDKALYYYEKNQKDGDGNTITSFDIRISFTDEEKNECFFRDIPLSSIKQITLCMDGSGEDGIPYAKYLTTTGTKLVSTLKDVKERLGIDGEDSEEDEETEDRDDLRHQNQRRIRKLLIHRKSRPTHRNRLWRRILRNRKIQNPIPGQSRLHNISDNLWIP